MVRTNPLPQLIALGAALLACVLLMSLALAWVTAPRVTIDRTKGKGLGDHQLRGPNSHWYPGGPGGSGGAVPGGSGSPGGVGGR
jgi:hypothetical protein